MGATQYFTGKPCKRGHVSPRLVSTRACLTCAAEANAAWRENNPGAMTRCVANWRNRNREKFREQERAHYASSHSAQIAKRIQSAMRAAMAGAKRGRKWEDLVGYSLDTLMAHLERQFSPGMDWATASEWHIDHIVPKVRFDLSTDAGVRACWALSNLRPLPASENCKKRHTLTHLL